MADQVIQMKSGSDNAFPEIKARQLTTGVTEYHFTWYSTSNPYGVADWISVAKPGKKVVGYLGHIIQGASGSFVMAASSSLNCDTETFYGAFRMITQSPSSTTQNYVQIYCLYEDL